MDSWRRIGGESLVERTGEWERWTRVSFVGLRERRFYEVKLWEGKAA